MPLHKPQLAKTPDARILTNAYLRCGANLYQVLRGPLPGSDSVLLEDCRTLAASESSREQVLAECELVIPVKP